MIRLAAIVMMGAVLTIPAREARGQDAIGGALLGVGAGAVFGGIATGRADGAVIGAFIGGTAGALIGAGAERRRGYYWWHGDCHRRVRGGHARVSRRYCY